ncbi:MAG: glycerol-3-phosphate 1-O-acyltransferase PlsY [Blastocatellia bacterium]|nr:glycerol-3-phosphate 1-O-acyltransferase PlsY [Blastocatellia bacterium]
MGATFFAYLTTFLARAAPLLLIAYLLGSIPFGYLLVRLLSGADIRATGSGATGATNVMRKAGRIAGVITLVLDAAKGFFAVLIVRRLVSGEPDAEIIIAISAVFAVIGHCFPVWLKFQAGKGVATGLGVFLAIVPWSVLAALLVFVLIVWRTRYVSLGSIAAAAFVPIWTLIQHTAIATIDGFGQIITALCATSGLIIWKHSANIRRLLDGTENKI